jgi:hypothetical protein
MSNDKPFVPGEPCWFELSTTDQPAAKRFYGSLLGWTFDEVPLGPPGGAVYSMAKLGGRDVGAISPMQDQHRAAGLPPFWMPYVAVASWARR